MLALFVLFACWAAHGLAQTPLSQLNQGVNVTDMNLSDLPQCAQDCLSDSAAEQAQGGCSAIDIKCLCSNPQYVGVLACCLDTKCSADDQKKAVEFNSGLCRRVNVTIPNFLGCSPGTNPFSNTTTTAGTSSSDSKSGSSGLSTGAKAGIGAGIAVLAVIAIAGLVAFLLFRKRKLRDANRFLSMQYQPSFMSPTETKRTSMATTAPLYGPPFGGPPNTACHNQQQQQQPLSELPSPPPSAPLPLRPEDRPALAPNELWFPGATMVGAASALHDGVAPEMRETKRTPAEMLGDTQIHQHHPALSPPLGPDQSRDEILGPHSTALPHISPQEPDRDGFGHRAEPVSPFINEEHAEGGAQQRIEQRRGGNSPGRDANAF